MPNASAFTCDVMSQATANCLSKFTNIATMKRNTFYFDTQVPYAAGKKSSRAFCKTPQMINFKS